MQSLDNVMEWLNKDFLCYATLIETISKEDDVEIVAFNSDGLCVKSRFSDITHICTKNIDFLMNLLPKLSEHGTFVVYNEAVADFLKAHHGFKWMTKCYHLTYTGKERFPLTGKVEIKIIEPTEENVQTVFEHYTLACEKESIRYHMEQLGVFGAYLGGTLVGFIGTHLEHTMGMLEVFPEYRRLGIGRELICFKTNHCLDNGIIPIAHVIENNNASFSLLTSLGFSVAKDKVCWIGR